MKNGAKNKNKKFKKWWKDENIKYVPANIINLQEEIHLKTYSVNLNGLLFYINKDKILKKPLAVKKQGNKLVLIMGLTGFIIAKCLDLKKVPVIIFKENVTYESLANKLSKN